MKKMILIISIIFITFFVLFFSHNHYFKLESPEIDFGTEIALTVNGANTTTFPKKENNLKVKNISCNEGIGYWDYSSWSLRVREIKNTKVKCNIDFVNEYHESLLNGTDPVLKDNLIPVTIENDGTVKRAKLGSEWYSYEKKSWANAIILDDESKTYYEGEVIPESNIESYFVWIPKYQYKLFDMGNYTTNQPVDTSKVRQIEVKFGLTNTVDSSSECKTPMESGASGSCSVGKYMTHPAFLSIPSNGMWIGKFVTNRKYRNENVNDASNISIKPNKNSWGSASLSNAFLSTYSYRRVLESHVMKNTEWGAMAYLSQSKYGVATKIRINNVSNGLTGYVSKKMATCGIRSVSEDCNQFGAVNTIGSESDYSTPYNHPNSIYGTTTGNISGIYDVGGIPQITMSFTLHENGMPSIGANLANQSGFSGAVYDGTIVSGISLPNKKYYDVYQFENNANNASYQRRILGDATGELGPIELVNQTDIFQSTSWYRELMNQYFSTFYTIAGRGYGYNGGFVSGVFAFQGTHGRDGRFRVVLAL